MPEAYVPQSRLLAELMARRHNPVQSIGQGLADVAGDVGEAYFIKKAAEKEAEKKQGDAGDMAAMLARAMNPQMNALNASVAQGGTPAQQAFPQGQTSAAEMLAGAMGTRAEPAFSPEMMKPLGPAQRASAAMQRTAMTNPEVAGAGLPMALELAQMTAPPKPRYFNAPDIGVMKDNNGELSVAQPVPAQAPKVHPDIEVAMAVNGGDKDAAMAWLKDIKTPKGPDKNEPRVWRNLTPEEMRGRNLPLDGAIYETDGLSVKPVAGTAPEAGRRWNTDRTAQEPIKGTQADQGRAGLPQAYREQESAYTQLDGALTEYETLVKKYGTESWNVTSQTKMKNLEKQITLAIKDIAKTGTLDEGTITFMDGLIPDATSFLANANVVNGKTKALANASSLRDYSTRGREALSKAYNVPLAAQGSEASPPPAGVSPEEWAGMTPEEKATFK